MTGNTSVIELANHFEIPAQRHIALTYVSMTPPHCCLVHLCKDLVLNQVRGSRSYLRRRGRKPKSLTCVYSKNAALLSRSRVNQEPAFYQTGQIAALWWLQGFSHDNKNCINTWKSISLYNMSKSWKKFLCISNFALWLSLPVLIFHCTQKHTYYQPWIYRY